MTENGNVIKTVVKSIKAEPIEVIAHVTKVEAEPIEVIAHVTSTETDEEISMDGNHKIVIAVNTLYENLKVTPAQIITFDQTPEAPLVHITTDEGDDLVFDAVPRAFLTEHTDCTGTPRQLFVAGMFDTDDGHCGDIIRDMVDTQCGGVVNRITEGSKVIYPEVAS